MYKCIQDEQIMYENALIEFTTLNFAYIRNVFMYVLISKPINVFTKMAVYIL